jgi:hypothetical protein
MFLSSFQTSRLVNHRHVCPNAQMPKGLNSPLENQRAYRRGVIPHVAAPPQQMSDVEAPQKPVAPEKGERENT